MSSTWSLISIPVLSSLFGSVGFGQTYTVTDLGTLGGHETIPLGINNSGQIAGFSSVLPDHQLHAFLWQLGVIVDLDPDPPIERFSSANAINDAGMIAGQLELAPEQAPRAVIFAGGAAIVLDGLGGQFSCARGMNKIGIAVGRAVNEDLEMRAVMWLDGDAIDLGFDGSSTSQAMDISSGGAVVIATIDREDNSYSAVLWEDGRLVELGTLGGRWAFPGMINDLNVVVGNSPIFSGRTHAFRWTAEEGMIDLGVLPGCLTSTAQAINRMNEIVGSVFDCQSGEFGVLWSGENIKDLNECVPPGSPRIVGASGINDARSEAASPSTALEQTDSRRTM